MTPSLQSSAVETGEEHGFRSRSLADRHLLQTIREHYEPWAAALPDDQYEAVSHWGGAGFKGIHSALRVPPLEIPAEIVQKIGLIRSALRSAPPLPNLIQSVFRGENHERLTLEGALALVAHGALREEKSFLATTVTENDAFLFARDYHSSLPILRDSFLQVPFAFLAPDKESQVIYEIRVPEDRSWLRAAYIGNSVGEVLFHDDLMLRYVDAKMVRYIPEEDYKWRHKVAPKCWDSRLLVTLEPIRAEEKG